MKQRICIDTLELVFMPKIMHLLVLAIYANMVMNYPTRRTWFFHEEITVIS